MLHTHRASTRARWRMPFFSYNGPSVFERYYRELLNFLAQKVRDRDAAYDLVQESFTRVYAAERVGMQVRDPRALLYRTARNLLIDRYRRADTASSVLVPEGGGLDDVLEVQACPSVLEPEAAFAARQRLEQVVQVVDSLPPRCREAFILVKFDGLSHAQTAQRMGIAVKTVEMQIQIALKACWQRMDELDGTSAAERGARGRSRKPR